MENKKDGRIIIRAAREDDYLGIMRISKGIYGGRDVVPAVYFEYLTHPDKYPWVAVKDGEIVGFQMYYVTDDGLTLIGEASRRDPAVRGGNLTLRMDEYMLSDILSKYPRIQHVRGASTHTDWWNKKHAEDTQSKVLMKRGIVQVAMGENLESILRSTSSDSLAKLSQQLPIGNIIEARRSDVAAIFQSKYTREVFFPEGIVVRNNEPFDVCLNSTIDTVIHDCQDIYITKYDDGQYESISFGMVLECPGGTMSAFDYFGSSRCKVILAHIVQHVSRIPRYYSGNQIMLHFFAPTRLVDEEKSKKINTFCKHVLNLDNKDLPYLLQYINHLPLRVWKKAQM